jgi:hypothetical protein
MNGLERLWGIRCLSCRDVLSDENFRLFRTTVSKFTSRESYPKRILSGVVNLRGMEELGKMENACYLFWRRTTCY